ncbi:organic cation transporter protein-like [Mytilus californianus]|uniref:organic cation transporter protein-like n=1 Tax=Mytilus californianus TaxID=6549 RepID=UPI0022480395|nr:organic cation transporter protein-like [Mytilus californianus]
MKFDAILTQIGSFGPYQKRNYVLLMIGWIFTGPFMGLSVFINGIPDHRCQIPGLENDTYEIQGFEHQRLIDTYIPLSTHDNKVYEQCNVYQIDQSHTVFDNDSHPINTTKSKCSSWVYSKKLFDNTFVMKENLVCDSKYKVSLSKTIFFGGVLLGSFMFGVISDSFVPESPRWLSGKGRKKEAAALLKHAAFINKTEFSEKVMEELAPEKKEAGKVWLLFSDRTLGCRTVVIFYNWMVASMVFYGLSLNTGMLYGDYYINFLLSVLMEFPGRALPIFMIDRIGRKKSHIIYMTVGGLSCLSTIFTVNYGGKVYPGTANQNKVRVFMLYSMIRLHINRSSVSRIFNFTIFLKCTFQFKANLVGGTTGTAIPLVIFGGACLIAAGLTLLLPETLNQHLPESIEDGKNFGKKSNKKIPEEFTVKNGIDSMTKF